MNIEICCGSIQSAANAKTAGATRIELCQNLNEGGTTPSYATIKQCVEMGLDVFVLVRPRPGNFTYNALDVANMEEDVKMCKQLGVSGIVVGFLDEQGNVDESLTRHFVELSIPIPVTFHRAFDRCRNWHDALEAVIRCGCKRVLTSGCASTAMEGRDVIKELVRMAGERITILAGSGVCPDNVRELIDYTGVPEVHGSCKVRLADGYDETDEERVRALLREARG